MTSRFHAGDPIETIAASVAEHGYAIVENALDAEPLERLKAELQPYFDAAHDGHDNFMGHRTRRFGALLSKSKTVRELVAHPTVLGVADRTLLPYCVNYHIHYTGVMQLLPGEEAQVIHRDTGIFPMANPCPPMTLATMWALSDFTRENGGTLVVPGSHRWPDERNPKKAEVERTQMPPGSVLMYTGNVLHGAGANNSNQMRTGLALHYGLGWLRQEENQYLAVPPEVARELPEQIQALMGYQLAAASFGFVDHIHPRDYLNGVRDVAESDVASPELREKAAALRQFSVTEATQKRSRFYEAE